MKRFALLLASVAFAGPAFAADVVYDEPTPPVIEIAPAYTFTGLYVGGQAGVAFGNDSSGFDFNNDDGVFGDDFFDNGNGDNGAGFIGGVHVGYDYQFSNNVLIGAIADINYIDADTSSFYRFNDGVGGVGGFGVDRDINFVGSVRGKLGYVFDRFAVYGTGGLAYADTDTDTDNDFDASNFASLAALGGNYDVDVNTDDDDVGYTVGGGVDYLVSPNFSVGLEYLYTDLGKSKVDVTYSNDSFEETFKTSSDQDLDFHTVWAKASFRFN